MQKIHVYLLCYNEEYIIESILNYYDSFCSKIFLLDNYSTDRSVEIAKNFNNLTIIKWKKDNKKMDDKKNIHIKINSYKQYSRKNGQYTTEVADWVIVVDMDEVLYHPNILKVLESYSKEGITVPQITGFDIISENKIDHTKSIINQYQYAIRTLGFDKRIIFNPEFDISYSIGCHPRGPGFENMKKTYGYKTSNEHKLALLHYKHIGKRFIDKAKEYSKLIDRKDVEKTKNGKYIGIGAHYLNIKNENYTVSPFLNKRKKLFYNDFKIRFNDFPETTGEIGIDKDKNLFTDVQMKMFADSKYDGADFLRELSLYFKSKKKYKEAFNIISNAIKLRPDGLHIQSIYKELKKYRDQ